MQLSFFYEEILPDTESHVLSEETSKHIVQVLRMNAGEEIILTNGKGYTQQAKIINADKKRTPVQILYKRFVDNPSPKICIAIGLIKNKSRFEWFIEKAAEIGISTVYPIITRRTEKQSFNIERIKSITISAMLQSQQSWLTEIFEPIKFDELIKKINSPQKFIAHCNNSEKENLNNISIKNDSLILIGPEGDFTGEEITLAVQNNFIPVSLGETRLRTETAAMVAAVICKFSKK